MKTTNLDNTLEVLGNLVNEADIINETNPEVFELLDSIPEAYILVHWPDSQNYMETEWFEKEAILSNTGSAAYFIPLKRLL